MSTKIMFTALPNGRVGDKLRISVFVSPRRDETATEGPLTGALVDLPARLGRLKLAVGFNQPGNTFNAKADDSHLAPATLAPSELYDLSLWQQLFPPGIVAKPFAVDDHNKSALASFSAKTVGKTLRQAYVDHAKVSTARPKLTKGALAAAGTLSDHVSKVATALKSTKAVGQSLVPTTSQPKVLLSKIQAQNIVPLTPANALGFEHARAAVFFNRGKWKDEALTPAQQAPAPAAVPKPDFNQVLGHLGDHPSILRRLGLVIDLLVDDPKLINPVSVPGDTVSVYVHVLNAGELGDASAVTPWTRCFLTSSDFTAYSAKDPAMKNGLLLLGNTNYFHVDDLDIDHAAMRWSEFSEKVSPDLEASTAPVETALPALRSVGLAVHRVDHEAVLGERINRPWTMRNAPGDLNFVAEELVRGYRVDVRPEGGEWKSLCKRSVKVKIGSGPVIPVADEGFIKATSLTKESHGVPLFNAHESLFHWNGWSLVAQRPGRSIVATATGENMQTETPQVMLNRAPADSSLGFFGTEIAPQPNTLHRLRFGKRYQFRMRAVDLAGNDLYHPEAAAPDALAVSAFTDCKRFEPVSSPTLVLKSSLTEGESVEHLVIRSNPFGDPAKDASAGMHPAAYAEWINGGAGIAAPGKLAMNPYAASCERHVAPPKVAQHLAELHGAFDPVLGEKPTPATAAAAYALAVREEGTFNDAHLYDVNGSVRAATGRVIVTPPGARNEDGTMAKEIPVGVDLRRGDALAHGQYVTYPMPTTQVALPYLPDPNAPGLALRGVTGSSVIRSYAKTGATFADLALVPLVLQESTSDSITVDGADAGGAPAAATPLAVSLPPAAICEATYSSTVAEPAKMALTPDGQAAVVQRGEHALVAPSRKIRFVHAVQQPKQPQLLQGRLSFTPRAPGETTVALSGALTVHGPSTGHCDLVATWDEISDIESAPRVVKHEGIVTTLRVDRTDGTMAIPSDARQSFGDTKHRVIFYKAVATSRFREYFPPALTKDARNITRESGTVRLSMYSTARPPAPRVQFVVPTFRWVDGPVDSSTGTAKRTRIGGGLRVYVDRGWYASGEDERLAVVLAKQPTDTKSLFNDVSLWGKDPVWNVDSAMAPLDAAHFVIDPAKADSYTKMDCVHPDGGVVSVVTFKPQWNDERKLWYFDIDLNTDNAFAPFVRLALARVQPFSVGDLQMSRVVRADFSQVVPDRTMSVAPSGPNAYTVSVQGISGTNVKPPTSSGSPGLDAASGRVVRVEIQEASTASPNADTLDWITIGRPVMLTPNVVAGMPAGTVQFTGTLPYPPLARRGVAHRVFVREYELYAVDNQDKVKRDNGVIKAGSNELVPYNQRLVYADSIPILR
jgi:hypothetical protein